MFVAWGLQLAQLHHDACIEILGDMHPTRFGLALRETWGEVIGEGKSLIDRAMSGETVTLCQALGRSGQADAGAVQYALTTLPGTPTPQARSGSRRLRSPACCYSA